MKVMTRMVKTYLSKGNNNLMKDNSVMTHYFEYSF